MRPPSPKFCAQNPIPKVGVAVQWGRTREDPMTETIRRVDYFYMTVPNKPGEGARALSTLREAGINLLAFSGFPSGRRSQINFVPEDPAAFRKVARKAGWKLSPQKTGFLIEGHETRLIRYPTPGRSAPQRCVAPRRREHQCHSGGSRLRGTATLWGASVG